MSAGTRIEWTERTKMCSACGLSKGASHFAADRSRADGLTYWCRDCRNRRSRELYVPVARPKPGRRFVPVRAGDVRQARRRVNYLIDAGLLPDPNEVACFDCGHRWAPGERRHEYDHHRGYDEVHHEDVQSVCTSCHHRRERTRRRVA